MGAGSAAPARISAEISADILAQAWVSSSVVRTEAEAEEGVKATRLRAVYNTDKARGAREQVQLASCKTLGSAWTRPRPGGCPYRSN